MKQQLIEQIKSPPKQHKSYKDTIAFAELCLLLNQQSYTRKELAKLVGVRLSTAYRWTNLLHRKKLIYISSWGHTATVKVAYYKWGYNQSDVEKPKRLTAKQKNERHRLKKKAETLKWKNLIVGQLKKQ